VIRHVERRSREALARGLDGVVDRRGRGHRLARSQLDGGERGSREDREESKRTEDRHVG